MTINITNELLATIALFFGLQVINVILNSVKTLIMAKTDNAHMSAGINALTFGFYTLVVNQIAHLDLWVTVPVTVVTNVIGVYLSYWLFRKLKKDSLWKIEIYCPQQYDHEIIIAECQNAKIPFAETSPNFLTVYCYTQAHSRAVKDALKLTAEHGTKYNITEINKKF